jgi:hypothetical protein
MRRAIGIVATCAGAVLLVIACRGPMTPAATTQQPAASAPTPNPVQRFNDSVAQSIVAKIGTRQNDSAASVFVNIQLANLKAVPARTFITIMNVGYARALGVTCEHCHDLSDFSSDAKRPKLAAREMAIMHRAINQELAKMQHIATPATQNRAINCSTCHRGTINPR